MVYGNDDDAKMDEQLPNDCMIDPDWIQACSPVLTYDWCMPQSISAHTSSIFPDHHRHLQ